MNLIAIIAAWQTVVRLDACLQVKALQACNIKVDKK